MAYVFVKKAVLWGRWKGDIAIFTNIQQEKVSLLMPSLVIFYKNSRKGLFFSTK